MTGNRKRATAALNSEEVHKLIDSAIQGLEQQLTNRIESLVSGLDQKISARARVHQEDSQPGEEQVKQWIKEAIQADSRSTVPASASRVSPAGKGIYPTLASISQKQDKERLVALIEK